MRSVNLVNVGRHSPLTGSGGALPDDLEAPPSPGLPLGPALLDMPTRDVVAVAVAAKGRLAPGAAVDVPATALTGLGTVPAVRFRVGGGIVLAGLVIIRVAGLESTGAGFPSTWDVEPADTDLVVVAEAFRLVGLKPAPAGCLASPAADRAESEGLGLTSCDGEVEAFRLFAKSELDRGPWEGTGSKDIWPLGDDANRGRRDAPAT